ncbi:MAG: UDP-glucose 4-epimerase GalE [Candidatus Gastranaerophilales bacterium]|nr:UDP-glucose 4-epimerase GalE [Candidatus Gastranaerophilales bacterium]
MILVTGGAGYIGSHLVLELLKRGYKVSVFDNLSTGHIETVNKLKETGKKNFEFIKGDLNNKNEINAAFSKEINGVIHFAASALVYESTVNPAKYYENNFCGTLNLLNSMRENNVSKIVFSSTAATYGEPIKIPIDENHPQNPINPYGKSKLMIEKMMDDYDMAYGIKSVRLRYFNVVGADSKFRTGEWHDMETHIVPNILKSLFVKNQTFKIFGTDYDTKDGTCVRDYVNVEDLAQAHILAFEYLQKGGKTDFFNIGTNEGNTVREIFEYCSMITGKKIPFEIAPRRKGDPARLVADNKKAKEILKWTPKKTLKESIQTAYEWEKQLNLQKN